LVTFETVVWHYISKTKIKVWDRWGEMGEGGGKVALGRKGW